MFEGSQGCGPSSMLEQKARQGCFATVATVATVKINLPSKSKINFIFIYI